MVENNLNFNYYVFKVTGVYLLINKGFYFFLLCLRPSFSENLEFKLEVVFLKNCFYIKIQGNFTPRLSDATVITTRYVVIKYHECAEVYIKILKRGT